MKGQTLIELLLGISIVGIILSGITVVVVASLSNAGYGKNQSVATQYAQEGIEVTRNTRNVSYTVFSGYSGNYCLSKGAQKLPSVNSPSCTTMNIDNFFIRYVVIEMAGCGAGISKATAVVSWRDNKCTNAGYCHKSQIASCLSTLNPIQGP